MKFAVLASGSGTNFEALAKSAAVNQGLARCTGLLTDKPEAFALERAKRLGIEGRSCGTKRSDYEPAMLQILKDWQPDVICLAGFMRVLSPAFIEQAPAPLLNIHPSLLPAYKGLNTHARVLASGERLHGCSVHNVTAELDAGQIIAQHCIEVRRHDTASMLQERLSHSEHQLFTEVLYWLATKRLVLTNKRWTLDGTDLLQPVRFYTP